ncbi:hypothetical protein JRQ81_003216 [Phrynocephalus forsythii]|uniref:SPATA31 domain-containing protein n=1 Tax=Phrynocephalus forsythii TaxID=171643 RepID=A0A9Q1AX84_9SAUR|nr:hypothetical protein JRQ81_003216 [Phrynocephalus forsythii]
MPFLIQKSLHCLFPTVPKVKIPRHIDVAVFPAQLSFLSHTIVQALERNVAKRTIGQQWRLPRRVLGSARLLGPEMVRAGNLDDGSRKPRAMVTCPPWQPQVLLGLQPDVLQKMMFHLEKKHMEVSLGAPPALARFSCQRASLSLKNPLPKLIPSGHKTLQKRHHFLPFGHPEDLDRIELSLRRNRLQSLWGLGSQYTEVVRRLMPRASGLPSRATGFPFSEVKPSFLPEQEREDLELHIRRKRVEHMWDFSALVQRSLGGFVGETPFPLTHWKNPTVHIHILHQELSFLSQDTRSYLEFHIQGMKQRHQWGLPKKVVESLRAMAPASVAGWRHFLPPSTQMKDGDLQERGADFDFSETQTPFLSNKDREGLELHLKKKRMQHEWSLPSLVKKSLESFMHRTPSLPYVQKARIDIQPKTEELSFLPADVCIFLEQHIQSMKHRQQWHLPKRILQSLRPLGWQLEAGVPGDQKNRVPHLGPERSGEKPPEDLEGRRTMVSLSSEAHLLLTLNSKDQQKMRLQLLRKCLEVQTAAFPALVRQSWLSVSSRQALPKHVGPHAPPCLRRDFLPFVWREELRQIELAVLRNHFSSLWGLGRSYVEALTALMGKLAPKPQRFRDVRVEFLEAQTPFLQEQFRECLEQHVRKKKLEHVWGLPGLVLKSISGCIHSAPPEPNPPKTEIHVRVLQQEPSFLPQSICRHLEFHLQRMHVQRQWRLPQRVLESTRIFHCPESGTHSSGTSRAWDDHWAVPKLLPEGVGQPEPGRDKNLLSTIKPKLQFHMAKKSTEVQLEAIPGVVRHSWPQITLSSKQHLPKVLHPGFALQRNSSFPFFHSGEAGQIDMAIRRAHLASMCGLEALGGITECKPLTGHAGLRWSRIEFLEAPTPFLQKQKREVLEAHITKKKIHHAWGFPILIQKSLKAFMQETPQLSLPKRTKVHVRILRQDPLFLPQKISSHLEFHIQKRKVQRQWGLPKQVLASLKIFFPVKKAPLSFSKELGDESFERGKEEVGQRWRTVVDVFSSDQQHAMQKHFERKHLQVHQEMEPKLVRKSQEKACDLGKEPGQKWLPNRAETSVFLTPSTTDDLEPSIPYKQGTSEWGLTRKSLEPLTKITSVTHAPIPARRWNACVQKVETPYLHLQSEQKEALEYHIKKKRLQHEWGLPGVVKRSVQAFAPPLLVPTYPSQGRSQEVRILIKEPSFLPALFQKALEDNLKRRIIRRQWGLPKRIHDSLRMCSPAIGKALGAAKEHHETVPVEEDIDLSEGNQQATEEVKETTEEVSVSGSKSRQTSRAGSLTSERPETLKQMSFSTGQPKMEGMAITTKTPPTTKEAEEGAASMAGLQAMENMACDMPQATEEVAFADESPEDATEAMVMFRARSLETSLGIEGDSETPLAADKISSVTQIPSGTVATLAVPGQSPFPVQHTVEGPPPTDKVSNGGKMPMSVEDTSPLPESVYTAKEKNLLIKSVEKSEQLAAEVGSKRAAREEENIPWQQSLQTIEEENFTGSQVPQSMDEENDPRSHSSQATGEDSLLQPQTSQSTEEENSLGPKSLQSVEEETSLEPQIPQSTEEEDNAELQSTEATKKENSSRLHSSPAAAAAVEDEEYYDEGENSSLGSQSSLVLKEEHTSGLLSLQATEDEDSWSPGATSGRNPPEESTVMGGTIHIPSGCSLRREKRLVKDKNLTAQQETLVSGEPPETVSTQEERGTQGGRGSIQDTEGTSMSEIPWAGLTLQQKLQHPMADTMRSKALTSSRGSPPKHTPEPLGAQLSPSHFPSHGSCKPVQGGHFQAPAKASLDPASGLQKQPPAYQNELKLWVGHGGRIVSWVSSEMPPFSTSLESPPSMGRRELGDQHQKERGRNSPSSTKSTAQQGSTETWFAEGEAVKGLRTPC